MFKALDMTVIVLQVLFCTLYPVWKYLIEKESTLYMHKINMFAYFIVYSSQFDKKLTSMPGGGGHSNTSVVHMRDQKNTGKNVF